MNHPMLINNDFKTTKGPCKLIGPKFEKFAEQYTSIAYAKVDVDAVPVSIFSTGRYATMVTLSPLIGCSS